MFILDVNYKKMHSAKFSEGKYEYVYDQPIMVDCVEICWIVHLLILIRIR